ncbi:MAG: hypothetical protein WA757_25220 [Candidatus Acidiferrales bacterium]
MPKLLNTERLKFSSVSMTKKATPHEFIMDGGHIPRQLSGLDHA